MTPSGSLRPPSPATRRSAARINLHLDGSREDIIGNSKTILVVIDPAAERQPALERSSWLAEHVGAALELLICDYDQQLSDGHFGASEAMEGARQALLDRHRRRLEALAAPLRERGLEVRTDTRWEHPLDRGVLRKLAELQPILAVKDTHYHGAVQRALFSNTDWNLIRRCAVPLLLVKPRQPAPAPRILAAIDPMHEFDKPAELDHAILALAKELEVALRGKLDVVHVFNPTSVIAGAAGSLAAPIAVPVRELTEALERTHWEALMPLLHDYSIDLDAVHLQQGIAAEQLLALSRTLPADIVVMGAVARSGINRVFIGNTAERVLDRLPCDLLIVRPAGFAVPIA